MAIESKSYTAGNNGGAFGNVDWNALMANPQSEPTPMEQVIYTFKNTNGDFNAKVDAAFDDLKKVASEFVDEFYKKMQGAFDNLNELNPDFVSAEAIRGNIDKIEILEQWIEQEEKEEQDKDVVESADEVLNQLREEAERERIQAWENAQSSEYPGLTNKEVLAGLRKICGNLPYYSDMAVKNGWIKAEDKEGFEEYMRRDLWLKEHERKGDTNSDEYRSEKNKQERETKTHPEYRSTAVKMQNAINGMGIEITNNNQLGQVVNLSQGDNCIDARATAFEGENNVVPLSPSSIAKAIDGNNQDTSNLSKTFNTVADKTTEIVKAPRIGEDKNIAVANNTGFNMNNGMI